MHGYKWPINCTRTRTGTAAALRGKHHGDTPETGRSTSAASRASSDGSTPTFAPNRPDLSTPTNSCSRPVLKTPDNSEWFPVSGLCACQQPSSGGGMKGQQGRGEPPDDTPLSLGTCAVGQSVRVMQASRLQVSAHSCGLYL